VLARVRLRAGWLWEEEEAESLAEEQRARENRRRWVRVITHHPRGLSCSASAEASAHVTSVQERSIFVPIFQENFPVVRMRRKEIPKRDTER
jgi:hypothetical protein